MKLYHSFTSPFVRKALVIAHELSLVDRITLHTEPTGALKTGLAVTNANPLSKIPTLTLDDGQTTLYDSRVICEYLDSLGGGKFFPQGEKRWEALRRQALADGIMDAAIIVMLERMNRTPEMRSQEWIDAQLRKVDLGLDAFEAEAKEGKLAGPENMTIGEITLVVALGWFDLRFGDRDWRVGRPALTEFVKKFEGRGSFEATKPPAS
ncbi:hypothetical protein HK097_006166 [Rhizophlyctis rosea]|uniref:Glutathione S-transferase n=1 Tax=Rhizophlyctis rosea TaxID=64517 RepID=A0AAD5X5Z6_9FUNG|nr:hypothetical protein HK097_006166 [Rhizophlyctis rosea]